MIKKTNAIIGNIFNDKSMGDNIAADYVKTGSTATFTNDNGSIIVSNGAGTLTETIEYKWYTSAEENILSLLVKPQVDGSGIYIGFKSVQTGVVATGLICKIDLSAGATRGQLSMGATVFGTYTESDNSGTDLLNFVTGRDTIILTLINSRKNDSTILIADNQKGQTVVLRKQNKWLQCSVSRPVIGAIGGTQSINNFKFDLRVNKYVNILNIGDSLTSQGGIADLNDSYSRQMGRRCKSSQAVCGTPGATSSNVLLLAPELALYEADYAIIILGSNDANPSIGASDTLFESNIIAIIAALTAVGTTSIVGYTPPAIVSEAVRNASIDSYNVKIAALPQQVISKTYSKISQSGGTSASYLNNSYYAGDGGGVHWNADGAKLVVDGIEEETNTILNW